jgi:hypothetical protein
MTNFYYVGVLAQGFADPARDFPAIMDGLRSAFNLKNWSVDWDTKLIWSGGATVFVTNPNPTTPAANHVWVTAAFAGQSITGSGNALSSLATHLASAIAPSRDVLMGTSTPALRALKTAVTAGGVALRPIVMAFSGAPTAGANPLYANEAQRLSDNIFTGITDHNASQVDLQIIALKILAKHWRNTDTPKLCILHTDTTLNPGKIDELADLTGASGLGTVTPVPVTVAANLTPASLSLSALNASTVDIAIVMGDPLTFQNTANIMAYFDNRTPKIPVMFWAPEVPRLHGALMGCGPDHSDLFQRGGGFVERILNGGKQPSQLSVWQPDDVDLKLVLHDGTRGKWGKPKFPVALRKLANDILT